MTDDDKFFKCFWCRHCRKSFTAQRFVPTAIDGKLKHLEIFQLYCPLCRRIAGNHAPKQKVVAKKAEIV